jgi:DNA (cytosine-5)-methyltransferase 1
VRYGSLFSGYGGLDRAVEDVFGAKAAWHSEIEPAPCRVLETRWPGVPNLGDVSKVDWSAVERPEILCGGFPCQDLSAAGKQAGLKDGTRSGLWLHFARAIRELRPELVVIENVRGLLNTEASHPAHQLGLCPGCLGDDPERVVLRALGAVLGDLADLGFDAEWCGLPASGVGAAHPRYRIIVLAWPADASSNARWILHGDGGPASDAAVLGHERGWQEARPRRSESADGGGTAADTQSQRHEGFGSGGHEPQRSGPAGDRPSVAHASGSARRPQQVAESWSGDPAIAGHAGERPAASDANRDRREGRAEQNGQALGGVDGERRDDAHGLGLGIEWGSYGPAIARWESVIGRSVPAPTFPGRNGQPKLSAHFVEWLMGLPDGWVTDVPGITVNERLKMLGNGVVPQQAEAGIRYLMERRARG